MWIVERKDKDKNDKEEVNIGFSPQNKLKEYKNTPGIYYKKPPRKIRPEL
jgi:hypothetical protein